MPTKILAIDDSKTMRLAIKITFAAEDAEVVAVSKGSEAVARAQQMGADVVLVDHTLAQGEPSGYEVCRALKSNPGTQQIPVVVLVAAQAGVDEAKLADCGAEGAVGKPFDTQELIDKVKSLAGGPAARPRPGSAPQPAARPQAPSRPQAQAAPPARRPSPPAAAPPTPTPQPSPPASAPPRRAPARPAAPTPAARPSGTTSAPPSQPSGDIPSAVPIPFASARSPTPGMLKRLEQAAQGAGAELDAQTAAALLALSREVIEQIVWEVVPELAEQIIREQQQARSA